MLRELSISYAVMRNYEELPHIKGTDLDLLVDPIDKSKMKIVFECLHKEGAYYIIPGVSSRDFASFMLFDTGTCKISGFRLDVNYGIYFKGHKVLTNKLLEESEDYHNFRVLKKKAELLCTWVKCFLNGEPIKNKLITETRKYKYDSPNFILELAGFIENSFRKRNQLIQFIEFSLAVDNIKNIDFSNYSPTFFQNSFSIIEKIKRYANPGGLWITFIGVDGSGKSTLLEKFVSDLENPTHGKVYNYHFRPKLLPARSRNQNPSEFVNPSNIRSRLRLKNHLKISYLFVDYILGYFFKIRRRLAAEGGVIVSDRGHYDLLYDPDRISLPKLGRVWRKLWTLLPEPDAVFVIVADPDIITLRKPERDSNSIISMQHELDILVQNNPKMHLVENNSDIASGYNKLCGSFSKVVENNARDRCEKK